MKYKLSDICSIITDYVANGSFKALKDNVTYNSKKDYARLIRFVDYSRNFSEEGAVYVSEHSYNFLKKSKLSGGELILANVGTIGEPFLCPLLSIPMTLGPNVVMLKTNDNICDQKYLYYYFMSRNGKHLLDSITSSSAVPKFNKTDLRNQEIDLPDLETQKKIVRILFTLDQKIELNNNESNTLQSIIDTQYRKVFSGNENNNKVKTSDLFDYEGGYSYTSAELVNESDIGMMTIKNFERTGGFKVDGFKALSPKKGTIKTAALYDIFISCTDVTQNADIIGNAVMLLDTDKYSTVTYSMDLVRIIPKINRFALYAILNSKDFKSFALGYKSGTTVLHLNKKCLAEYEIALPDERSLDFFGTTVEKACKKIAINLAENRTLRQIRDTLLPKLMSGEINLNEIK